MSDTTNGGPAAPEADRGVERQLRDMNEALLISSVKQHELAERAEKAEAALRESERMVRLALDSADLGTFHIDPATSTLTSDARLRAIFGSADERLEYEQAFAAIHPDDQPRIREAGAAADRLDGPVPFEAEFRVVQLDRSVRWVFAKGRTNFAGQGSVRKVLSFDGTVADITERKRAEEALQAGERRLEFVLDSMPQKIFTAGLTGAVDYFNPQWMEFTGLSFEQIKGWGWTQFIHPDDVEQTVRRWQHSVDTGERFHCEHRFRRADGEYRRHVSRAVPMHDEAGQVIMWIGANTDVDDLARAEQALRSSEVQYRRLFQTATDGLIILDITTGRIIDANAVTSELLGRQLSELVGRELPEVGFFEDRAAYTAGMESLREKGHLRHDSLPVRHRNGRTTQVEFVSNAYEVAQRMLAQCNLRDITVRAAMEQQIKAQALNLAEQDRRKDEFMAMLSHELRNPLAPIRSATHILRLQTDGTENSLQRQAREIIERQVGVLTRLVDDLMEVSRVVSGKIRLVMVTVDLCEAVRQALGTVTPVMVRRGHEVSVALPDGPVWVHADPTRLEQVIVNLLHNAAKFTDEGGRIQLSLGRHEGQSELRISDSGIGIAPEMLEHVFDLFAQADRSLARSDGGLGIGLSLVHRLVALHGGTVEAKSSGIHQGSEFIVRLPVAPMPSELSHHAPSLLEEHGTKALRVLVVDDNVDGCTMLAAFVGLKGYAVTTASNGPAAIATATDWRPDVVLLDIGLPGLSGFDVARRLRADPANKAIKLVAVSGYGREQDLERGREAGFDLHLVKPIDLTVVEQLLANVANQPSG